MITHSHAIAKHQTEENDVLGINIIFKELPLFQWDVWFDENSYVS